MTKRTVEGEGGVSLSSFGPEQLTSGREDGDPPGLDVCGGRAGGHGPAGDGQSFRSLVYEHGTRTTGSDTNPVPTSLGHTGDGPGTRDVLPVPVSYPLRSPWNSTRDRSLWGGRSGRFHPPPVTPGRTFFGDGRGRYPGVPGRPDARPFPSRVGSSRHTKVEAFQPTRVPNSSVTGSPFHREGRTRTGYSRDLTSDRRHPLRPDLL